MMKTTIALNHNLDSFGHVVFLKPENRYFNVIFCFETLNLIQISSFFMKCLGHACAYTVNSFANRAIGVKHNISGKTQHVL